MICLVFVAAFGPFDRCTVHLEVGSKVCNSRGVAARQVEVEVGRWRFALCLCFACNLRAFDDEKLGARYNWFFGCSVPCHGAGELCASDNRDVSSGRDQCVVRVADASNVELGGVAVEAVEWVDGVEVDRVSDNGPFLYRAAVAHERRASR